MNPTLCRIFLALTLGASLPTAAAPPATKAPSPAAPSAATCPAAAAAAERVHTLRVQLAAFKTFVIDDAIPQAAQQGVPALREALADAADAYMQCVTYKPNASQERQIGENLAKLLQADARREDEHSGVYGGHLYFNATGVPGSQGDFVRFIARFDVNCDNDYMLLSFQRQPGAGWRRILDWRAQQYTQTADALGGFLDFVDVPGAKGQKLVAIAHGTPSCTSVWSRFDVNLIAPATATAPQQVLGHDRQRYNRGEVIDSTISASDGYVRQAHVASRDASRPLQEGVFHYRTRANTLERQPSARDASLFFDAWLDAPWALASRWTVKPSPELKALHERLNAPGAPALTYPSDAGSDFVCEFKGKSWVYLQMTLSDKTTLYAMVAKSPSTVGYMYPVSAYAMLSITPDLPCAPLG